MSVNESVETLVTASLNRAETLAVTSTVVEFGTGLMAAVGRGPVTNVHEVLLSAFPALSVIAELSVTVYSVSGSRLAVGCASRPGWSRRR